MRIIRNCDICGKEDTIDCETGLCPDCEKKELSIRNFNLKQLKKINEKTRKELSKTFMETANDGEKNKRWDLIEELIENEINIYSIEGDIEE